MCHKKTDCFYSRVDEHALQGFDTGDLRVLYRGSLQGIRESVNVYHSFFTFSIVFVDWN